MYNYAEYEAFWSDPISDYTRLLEPYLQKVFKEYLSSNILEIGFGSGHLALIFKQLGFNGYYQGIDTDPGAVDFAQKNIKNSNFYFSTFKDYTSLSQKPYDLAIFCLSACEMDDDTIQNYLKNIRTNRLLIINPSTVTNYFESRIVKPFFNKFLSRLGATPRWKLIARIPDNHKTKRLYNINNRADIPASMYYRATGDILNLCKQSDYIFESYAELKYTENTIKTAPIAKFEMLCFQKKS